MHDRLPRKAEKADEGFLEVTFNW
jgi:hypothetical protein